MMNSKKRYYFESGKLFEEQSSTYEIGLQTSILAEMAENASILVNNIHPGVDYLSTSIRGGRTYTTTTTEVMQIKLNTYYEPYEGEVFGDPKQWPALHPTFKDKTGTIKKDFTWTPPPYMKIFFINEFRDAKFIECYLVVRMGEDIHRPPFPNVYENGKVCMGNHFTIDSKLTIIEAHNKAVKDIEETSWNTDLMDGQSRFILFTDDGKPIYPDEALYKRHLPIISNPRLGFMKGVK